MGMLDDVKSKKKQKAAENWIKMGDSAKTAEKQVEYYTKSLDIDPYSAEAWFKKGKALEKMRRLEEAKNCFDLAIEADPDYQGLIGAYGSTENVEPSPLVEEEVYETETPVPAIEEEMMEEELLPEPEIVTTSEPSDEGVSSYQPPVGDESIFSNVISGEESDNGSPSYEDDDHIEEQEELEEDRDLEPETFTDLDSGIESSEETEDIVFGSGSVSSSEPKEHDVISGSPSVVERDEPSVFSSSESVGESEETFSSPSEPTAQEPVSSYTADENVIGSSRPETISSAPAPVNTPVAASVPPVSETPKKQAAGYDSSSSSIVGSKPVAISGADLVDIRIPLNETLKFWAVGVVAMLVVLILSKIL